MRFCEKDCVAVAVPGAENPDSLRFERAERITSEDVRALEDELCRRKEFWAIAK